MKKTVLDLSSEKSLLINSITSTDFLKGIRTLIKTEYLKVSYCKTVMHWVVEYYQAFHESPGKNIQNIYLEKRGLIEDDEDSDNIKLFLTKLSEEYEQSIPTNIGYAIQQAVQYLKIRSLEVLHEQLGSAIQVNDTLQGEQFISNYNRIEQPLNESVSILKNSEEVKAAFLEEEEYLFSFPGALGQVCGRFNRGDFASFLAPMKRGKSHFLWYTAETALAEGYRVIFFTLEMTKNEMIRRAWSSLVGQPKYKDDIEIPKFESIDENKYKIVYEQLKRKVIDPMEIEKKQKAFRRIFRQGDARIISVPAYSATVEDLIAYIDNMEHYDNFISDVIIIDYADIVASMAKTREYRHQLDDTWKRLRRLAQERNVLVVTASQSEKSTLKRNIEQGNVAEDIRKLAHVTHMLALNQNETEAQKGIMRVNQLAVREGKRSFQTALVLQCLDIGRPCLDSRFEKDVIFEENSEKSSINERKRR